MPNQKGSKYDFAGQIINKLRVDKYVGKSKWECTCLECGNKTIKTSWDLDKKRAYSCGCCNRNTDDDLTGQHFEKLTAQYKIKGKDGRTLWHCTCDCGSGKTVDVRACDLLNGKAKSCGCMRHNNEADNLIGQTFNYLKVIGREPNDKNSRSMWRCKCLYNGCGNEVVVMGKRLLNGNTKSCGCLKHRHKYDDLTGNIYGDLTVDSLAYIKGNIVFWNCHCTCGNTKVIRASSLTQNKVYTCGHSSPCHNGSRKENEIKDYIISLGVSAKKANRILGRKEIDIYVAERKIGVEYNGSMLHSSLGNPFVDKDKYYHRDKFLQAKEKGIHLINIFDIDWNTNQEKIKMYLRSLFLPQESIMARKCEVKKVSNDTACEFVEKYHLQGANKATMKINYGLFYEGELYAVMSFGKIKTEEGQYELYRYCVKDGYTITDGAKKLLCVFEEEYSPKYIVAYSDNDYFTGDIYSLLGFEEKQQLEPNYYWYNKKEELYVENCELGDNNNDDMLKLGSCKVYRSGITAWIKRYNEKR